MTRALALLLQDQIPGQAHMVSLFSLKMKSLDFYPVFCVRPAARPQGGDDLFEDHPHPSHSDAVAVPPSQVSSLQMPLLPLCCSEAPARATVRASLVKSLRLCVDS